MAIVVDGTDTAINGTIGFEASSIRQPRRPLAGVAIAVLTAVVTMGAMGPRPADPASGAAACAPATAAPVADARVVVTADPGQTSPEPWWLLPQVAEWVDPATGRSMQAQVDHARRVADDGHFAHRR